MLSCPGVRKFAPAMGQQRKCEVCGEWFKASGLQGHARHAHGLDTEAARALWERAETKSGEDWAEWGRRYAQALRDIELIQAAEQAEPNPRHALAIDAICEQLSAMRAEPL